MPEKDAQKPKTTISEAVGSLIEDYQWLVFDAFLFLILITAFLGYKDFGDVFRLQVRGFFVFSLWIFFASSLHILAFLKYAKDGNLSNRWSLAFVVFKFISILSYTWWAICKCLATMQ